MEMKQLLQIVEGKESMKSAEKAPTGPKFTGYWKGTDPRTPGNKMVGGGAEEYDESILKDLSKGPRAKTIEEELAEAYAQFNEDDLGVEPKRPAREGSRHPRGHEPHPRYKTIKTDEAGSPTQQAAIAIAMKKAGKKPKNESAMSEKDIELQDYRSMSHKEFQTAYGMTKTEWINKNKALVIQNPKIKQALGLEEGRAEVDKWAQAMYDTIEEIHGWAVAEQFEEIYYARDLQQLTNLIADNGLNINAVKAIYRTLKKFGPNDDYSNEWEHLTGWLEEYLSGEEQISEGAEQDPIVAKVVKQMRPGLKNLDLSNEAFLYFAYELGKDRARDAWSDYLPAIRAEYEKGLNESADLKKQADKYTELAVKANKLGDDEKCKAFQKKVADIKKKMAKLEEGWESGPEEYEEPYDDADDAYDRQRQAKLDAETEKEWAKKPKVTTYQLSGRGPNMEPNYEFPGEYASQEEAIAAREKLMADPKTPYPQHIGIRTINRVKESRGHKIIANKLKDIERAKKFASGELKVPTPQERQAQLKKLEKKPKTAEDLQPMDDPQAGNVPNMLPTQADANDPAAKKQVQNVLQATQKLNAATGSKAASPEKTDQALDKIMQGKPIDASEIKTVQPLLKSIAPAAQNPQNASKLVGLINQLKSTN